MNLPPNPDAPRWPRGLPVQTRLQSHLHHRYRAQRTAIVAAMGSTPFPDDRKVAARLASCCSTAFIVHDPKSGRVHPWFMRCNSRLCPFCGRANTDRLARKIGKLVATMKQPRHIVLTFRHTADSLPKQILAIRQAFSKFRRDPDVARYITGGVYSIEIKRDLAGQYWHVHLHIIAEGAYFPQKLLCKLWRTHMSGGDITWITAVDDSEKAAYEITKYIAKPPTAVGWSAQAIVAYARATHGTRMLQTFGTLHGRKLPATETSPEEKPAVTFANVPHIAYLASRQVPIAMDLAALMWCRWPMLRRYLEDVAPEAAAGESLHTQHAIPIPRPPPAADGRYGPYLDRKDVEHLDCWLDMCLLFWNATEKRGELGTVPETAEV